MKIGERLVHFRQQYDLTQDEVVDLLNKEEYKISKSKYCRLETNKSEHTIEFILHFVKILKDKQKVLSDKRDISIFSFLYKGVDDSVNKDNKDLQCINDAKHYMNLESKMKMSKRRIKKFTKSAKVIKQP